MFGSHAEECRYGRPIIRFVFFVCVAEKLVSSYAEESREIKLATITSVFAYVKWSVNVYKQSWF